MQFYTKLILFCISLFVKNMVLAAVTQSTRRRRKIAISGKFSKKIDPILEGSLAFFTVQDPDRTNRKAKTFKYFPRSANQKGRGIVPAAGTPDAPKRTADGGRRATNWGRRQSIQCPRIPPHTFGTKAEGRRAARFKKK